MLFVLLSSPQFSHVWLIHLVIDLISSSFIYREATLYQALYWAMGKKQWLGGLPTLGDSPYGAQSTEGDRHQAYSRVTAESGLYQLVSPNDPWAVMISNYKCISDTTHLRGGEKKEGIRDGPNSYRMPVYHWILTGRFFSKMPRSSYYSSHFQIWGIQYSGGHCHSHCKAE